MWVGWTLRIRTYVSGWLPSRMAMNVWRISGCMRTSQFLQSPATWYIMVKAQLFTWWSFSPYRWRSWLYFSIVDRHANLHMGWNIVNFSTLLYFRYSDTVPIGHFQALPLLTHKYTIEQPVSPSQFVNKTSNPQICKISVIVFTIKFLKS